MATRSKSKSKSKSKSRRPAAATRPAAHAASSTLEQCDCPALDVPHVHEQSGPVPIKKKAAE